MTRNTSRNRHGLMLLGTAFALGVLVLISGFIQALRGRVIVGRAAKLHREMVARDLVQSILAEATREMMLAANRPGDAFAGRLRRPAGAMIEFEPRLDQARKLAAAEPSVARIGASVCVHDREPLVDGPAGEQEWEGRVELRATVVGAGPGALTVTAREERVIKVTAITPPRPLDRFGFIDVSRPPSSWYPALPGDAVVRGLALDPAVWERKATLRVTGAVTRELARLQRRLGMLNGVVLVDNAGGEPLELRNLTWMGKTVLVVRGAVEIEDVKMAEEGTDLLTVIAFGDVTVSGTNHAALILTRNPGGRSPRRRLTPGCRIQGSLIVTEGTCQVDRGAGVDCDTRWTYSGASGSPIPDDRLYTSISPQLEDHEVEVTR